MTADDAERYGRHSRAHASGPHITVLLRRLAAQHRSTRRAATDGVPTPVLPKRRPRSHLPARPMTPPIELALLHRVLAGLEALPTEQPHSRMRPAS